MAISALKFKESDFAGKDVESLPDIPAEALTAAELKARFDHIAKRMLALGAFNALIDALCEDGAGDIGISCEGISSKNVKGAISEVMREIKTSAQALKATVYERTGTDRAESLFFPKGERDVLIPLEKSGRCLLTVEALDINGVSLNGAFLIDTDEASVCGEVKSLYGGGVTALCEDGGVRLTGIVSLLAMRYTLKFDDEEVRG